MKWGPPLLLLYHCQTLAAAFLFGGHHFAQAVERHDNAPRRTSKSGIMRRSVEMMIDNHNARGSSSWKDRVTLLGQREAQALDEELFKTFSVDQLMELAGLSVAQAVDDYLVKSKATFDRRRSSILIICGPGNNGGDGLVAARHLSHFGYTPTVVYPKRAMKPLYENLVRQCVDMGIEVSYVVPDDIDLSFDAVIDAIFGFGFTGPIKPPFDQIVRQLSQVIAPVVSVDVPSGWDVEKGDILKTGFSPEVLVSLTAPKKCAAFFRGRHYVGGRFVPPSIRQKYELRLPPYPDTSQFLELEGWDVDEDDDEDDELVESARRELQASSDLVVVWVTASSMDEARKLSQLLVTHRLAACVSVLPGVESYYNWEDKLDQAQEVMMMVKTRKQLVDEVSSFVKEHHSYDLPETIAADVVGGSEKYMEWVRQNTKPPGEQPSEEMGVSSGMRRESESSREVGGGG